MQLLEPQFTEEVGVKWCNQLYTSQGSLGLSALSLSYAATSPGQ